MSHSVKVTIIADQEIELLGEVVNIHDIETLYLDSHGKIIECKKRAQQSVQSDKGKLPHLGNPCVFCGVSQNRIGAVLGVCPCR